MVHSGPRQSATRNQEYSELATEPTLSPLIRLSAIRSHSSLIVYSEQGYSVQESENGVVFSLCPIFGAAKKTQDSEDPKPPGFWLPVAPEDRLRKSRGSRTRTNENRSKHASPDPSTVTITEGPSYFLKSNEQSTWSQKPFPQTRSRALAWVFSRSISTLVW